MTNAEAFAKAKAALDKADDQQSVDFQMGENGKGWGNMESHEIYDFILWYLRREFQQGAGK